MPTDPKSNVSQNQDSNSLENEIERLLSSGLENFGVRELMGLMLSAIGQSERRTYLAQASADKGNGGYGRSLNVGSIPVNIEVPRTRSGNFRPRSLPPPYQRGYSDEMQALLLGLLGSARSINAAKTALKKMGLGSCSEELDSVASGLVEELELVNSRPVDPDLLAIFLDGKYVESKDVGPIAPRLHLPRRRSSPRREEESPGLLHSIRTRRPPGMEGRPSFPHREGFASCHDRRSRRLLGLARSHRRHVPKIRHPAVHRPHAPKRQDPSQQDRRLRVHQEVPLHQNGLDFRCCGPAV